eukprot:TRINITY_DN18243_c0_g1_i1.p2 TRINITY_DN18243_c0_g1~~TRINITY_DN18243_c0_g1_i1.p2  ORF type:complete len:153 (-),score=47.20 TRINITY_DN18243_c0_g1_i1:118-576(-)
MARPTRQHECIIDEIREACLAKGFLSDNHHGEITEELLIETRRAAATTPKVMTNSNLMAIQATTVSYIGAAHSSVACCQVCFSKKKKKKKKKVLCVDTTASSWQGQQDNMNVSLMKLERRAWQKGFSLITIMVKLLRNYLLRQEEQQPPPQK